MFEAEYAPAFLAHQQEYTKRTGLGKAKVQKNKDRIPILPKRPQMSAAESMGGRAGQSRRF